MGSAEKPPLVEHEVIRDTVVTGIGDIQVIGHNARITLYVDQGGSGGNPEQRIVVAKLFVTLESIPSGILDVIRATGRGISHALFAEMTEADRTGRH
jgi:predicted ABC-type transport system involved in lysophospholipase L1 biosynthesis ATPase subunit